MNRDAWLWVLLEYSRIDCRWRKLDSELFAGFCTWEARFLLFFWDRQERQGGIRVAMQRELSCAYANFQQQHPVSCLSPALLMRRRKVMGPGQPTSNGNMLSINAQPWGFCPLCSPSPPENDTLQRGTVDLFVLGGVKDGVRADQFKLVERETLAERKRSMELTVKKSVLM